MIAWQTTTIAVWVWSEGAPVLLLSLGYWSLGLDWLAQAFLEMPN